MHRSVPSTLVARQFVKLAEKEKNSLTPLQLIKFSYLAHGWSFAYLDEPLVCEEVEAWKYGPVFPELYHILKRNKGEKVDQVAKSLVEKFSEYPKLRRREKRLIKSVYETYKNLSGSQLISLTSRKGTPFSETSQGEIIDSERIEKYYKERAQEND